VALSRERSEYSSVEGVIFFHQAFADELQMKREALEKVNRQANEMSLNPGTDPGTAMIQ
jgi:hypothetical protein